MKTKTEELVVKLVCKFVSGEHFVFPDSNITLFSHHDHLHDFVPNSKAKLKL